ncbi:MAG: sensor domain-containing diguanylate cyclase [Chitinivibrionia bacterium]|nr:sensor domain-containing diguanylate cyclase [Chitinivibrionia bacterium]
MDKKKWSKNLFEKVAKKPSKFAIISFLCSLLLCSAFIFITVESREKIEASQMQHLMLDRSFRLKEVVGNLLYKNHSLALLARQGYDVSEKFETFAPLIFNDPALLNFVIAPNGVVSNVYPMEGNKAVLNWNFLDTTNPGNAEAIAAIEKGEMLLAGPFHSAQGVNIITGRLPVYLETYCGASEFWGLVSVALKFEEIINSAALNVIENKGFSYKLWRVNPDNNGERQIIAGGKRSVGRNARVIESPILIANAEWHLKIWSSRSWYNYLENIALIVAGIFISLLVMFVVHDNVELNRVKLVLEGYAKTDPLTGAYNRRHFMDMAKINIERARRAKKSDYIIIFDLDKFKSINDTYTHIVGDRVLADTALRIKSVIRQYDLFARYGGEEFIIYAPETDRKGMPEMTERLRTIICAEPIIHNDLSISVSASFGIAQIENYDLDAAILHADKALYAAKSSGRNKVQFWDELLASRESTEHCPKE